MALTGIIIFILVLLAVVLALRFLFGILRVVVIVALAIVALALLYMFFTGNDVLGFGPTVAGLAGTTQSAFGDFTGRAGELVNSVNQTVSSAKEIAGYVPTLPESSSSPEE